MPARSNPKPAATAASARSSTERARNSPPASARASAWSASSWMCGFVGYGFRFLQTLRPRLLESIAVTLEYSPRDGQRHRLPLRRRQHAARQRRASRPTCAATSTEQFGDERQQRYWEMFERLRAELGYADYLGALQRYPRRVSARRPPARHVVAGSIDYPFAERLYPRRARGRRALRASRAAGDPHRRRRRVPAAQDRRSGLWDAFDGDVLDLHPQGARARGRRAALSRPSATSSWTTSCGSSPRSRMPGATASRPSSRGRGTTRTTPRNVARYPPADVTVDRVGDLLELAV